MTPITFLHMPKTAGTSIISAMQSLPDKKCYVHGETAAWKEFEGNAPTLGAYNYIAGHLTMEQVDLIPGDKRIFTVVRPPVDRILSWYDFLCRARRATLHPWTQKGDVHTFIEKCRENRRDNIKPHPNAMEMFNGMCRRLHPDATAASALKVIRERGIRVLNQSRLADDMEGLSDWIVLPDLPRLNVTAKRNVHPESVYMRIAELNAEDERLYEALSNQRATSR